MYPHWLNDIPIRVITIDQPQTLYPEVIRKITLLWLGFKETFVSCNIPKKIRVGRSDFYNFLLFHFFAKGVFVGKRRPPLWRVKIKIISIYF